MTADGWARAVRRQLGLGRLLPLGGPRDGAWIAEEAAAAVLRRAARERVPGVRLGALRLALADPAGAPEPVVPPPPSALPPGPLRITADLEATASEPLPAVVAALRSALAGSAASDIGLTVTEVDLRVTALLDEPASPSAPPPLRAPSAVAEPTEGDAARAARAALAVPGVAALTGRLGGLGRPVHIEDRPGTDPALTARHVRLEVAVGADHHPAEVARTVRTAVAATFPDHPTVAVLVTAVG
ncbi:nucleopolyhedrovirus P10 family protein [Streptomyces sp. NPDC058867]|uniref:nucleopolyhedrovirus P10 family protein n=1 Tax=unclassified Streptomyces TaxID=2593676 RepID=UPI0036C5D969